MSQPGDDKILKSLEDSGIELTPSVIAHNLDYSRRYVTSRVRELSENDLIEKTADEGYYKITERGRAYLYGEIDAGDLQETD